MEIAEKRDLINYDNLKRDDSRDPFLEDEGFAPSDISGATTPKKTPPSMKSSYMDRRDSFKLARTSQSQERKTMGTPQRTFSTDKLEKPVIMPNEITKITQVTRIEQKDTNQDSKPADEPKTFVATITKTVESADSKVEATKKTLFNTNPAKPFSLFSTNTDAPKTTSIFNQPKDKEEEEKKEKPEVKSIFGPSADTIEELRRSRASNNSSPSFGETKNPTKEVNTPTDEKTEPKKISLFVSKSPAIAESPVEEEQASQEDKAIVKPKAPLFKSGGLFSKPVVSENPTANPVEISKPSSQGENPKPEKPSGNPFLVGANAPKPMNLFAKSGAEVEVPKRSLFGGPVAVTAAPSQGTPTFNLQSSRNLFGSSILAGLTSNGSNKLFTTVQPTQVGNSIFNAASKLHDDDVGMGETTPPTQSPVPQGNRNPPFPFSKPPTGGSIFGAQGSKGSENTAAATTSLFGKPPMTNTGTMFSMGSSKTPSTAPKSGLFGGSGPSQGQPNNPWTSNPFGNKQRKAEIPDDDLFK